MRASANSLKSTPPATRSWTSSSNRISRAPKFIFKATQLLGAVPPPLNHIFELLVSTETLDLYEARGAQHRMYNNTRIM
ncbi:hypothetical protein MSG28_008297 [Choristoneura fumiferana]|uniref:Uncharacterized protein n=2 Tax=Choristoneura fumiferana TaxID=7141 RepID=A0ACC0JAW2_CHOFU|nr:hypothetical protein MSG28_008297 [Choristoneura fumiferana]KAI8421240.1 hypothetical protein MSG28_008297 [Choristoneura fumiferana]